MNLRRSVRNLQRHGTELYGVVERITTGAATVRLVNSKKKYTNLPVIGRVEEGDTVIIDLSLGNSPYVRPITVDEDEVVEVFELKAQKAPNPPLQDVYVSSTTGGKGLLLWHGVLWDGYNDPPPDGWYEYDYDDTSWGITYDIRQHSWNPWVNAQGDYEYELIPAAIPISVYMYSPGYYAEQLIRHTIYIAEIESVPKAELIFNYDDIMYAYYLNGTKIWGPDLTHAMDDEKGHRPPFVIDVADLLVEGKNVFAMWTKEQHGIIWPWNPARQYMVYQLTLDRQSTNEELLLSETIDTIRVKDDGGSMAPYGSGQYIPDFDSVVWGDESFLRECPASIPTIGLVAGTNQVYLGDIPAKYAISIQFDAKIPDASSYPRVNQELLMYFYWVYSDSAEGTYVRNWFVYSSKELWFKNSTDVFKVSYSLQLAVDRKGSFLVPRLVRGPIQASQPDTMVVSNLQLDVMKIADISNSPRSIYGSHWDEWYEKYPEYL